MNVDCPTCDGSGKVHSHNPTCWTCRGTGQVSPQKAEDVCEMELRLELSRRKRTWDYE